MTEAEAIDALCRAFNAQAFAVVTPLTEAQRTAALPAVGMMMRSRRPLTITRVRLTPYTLGQAGQLGFDDLPEFGEAPVNLR